jgi:CHC2 zinc finger
MLRVGEKAWFEGLARVGSKFVNSHLRIILAISEKRVNSQMRINVEIQSSFDFEGAIVANGSSAQTKEDIREVIKRIKESIDLASYVGKFVAFKKEGRSLKGLCPFHEERSPSFSINQKNGGQHFHCFGCGKKGDIIDFVAGYDGCTVGEVIRKLRVGEDVAVRPMLQKPVEPIQIPTTSADKLQAFHQ